jgi:RNA recognition motif-containing protein
MSANKAYVGNLPFNFTQVDLQELFQGFGPVRSAQIITDRETGRSRGFGFVEMETPEALAQAIAGLHERNVQGRNLTVNEARERVPGAAPRPSGGFGSRPTGPRPGGPSFRPTGAPSFSGDSGGPGPGRGRHDKGGGDRDRFDRERGRGKRGRDRGDSDDGY